MKNSIIDLIIKIKQRPGMYLGSKSVVKLRVFLEGYIYAMVENNFDCQKNIYDDFNEWFRKKYEIRESYIWDRFLSDTISNPEEAIDKLYEEFELYLSLIQ